MLIRSRGNCFNYKLIFIQFSFNLRHSVVGNAVFWRCCNYKILGCKARLKTRLRKGEKYGVDRNFDDENQMVEVVSSEHNHEIITERRKKGEIKNLNKFKEIVKESRNDSDEEIIVK